MKVPAPLHTVANLVYGWWQERGDSEPERGYLGASAIGGPCERALWYGFRFASPRKFEGRTYRLFNRGQREEATIVEELRGIGCEVSEFNPDGEQWGFKAIGGHFSGHMDGAVSNTPYAKAWAVLEAKTHSVKSFKELTDKGVAVSHPTHWHQMNVYMGQMGMDRAMYYAVAKDTDAIHTEWLHFDQEEYDKMMARAERIITAAEPPLRLSDDASWYQCKWCDHSDVCHGTEAPRATCRTCAHSTPITDKDGAVWDCAKHSAEIPIDAQRTGCAGHRYIPILLANFAEYLGTEDGENPLYRNTATGREFHNGEADKHYTSIEIRAAKDKKALGDAGVDDIKQVFAARVEG